MWSRVAGQGQPLPLPASLVSSYYQRCLLVRHTMTHVVTVTVERSGCQYSIWREVDDLGHVHWYWADVRGEDHVFSDDPEHDFRTATEAFSDLARMTS